MILTVSNEFLLEYVLNNGVFIGEPKVIVKGQMFTLLNLTNQAPPPVGAMRFTLSVNEGDTFVMPTPDGGTYNYNVNWGDSMQDDNVTDFDHSHLFAAGGIYTVWLTGTCTHFVFQTVATPEHLISVETLGNLSLLVMNFMNCLNLVSFTAGLDVDTSGMASGNNLFSACSSLIDCDLNGVDFSNITQYQYAFNGCVQLENLDHTPLDMTNAVTINNMFAGCSAMLTPAPEWWLIPEITGFENCFFNNLLRPNYIDIPPEWKGIETPTKFTIQVNEGETFVMPTPDGGTYNYTVNWGDGIQDDNVTDFDHSHFFAAGGIYIVWLTGTCTEFAFEDTGTSKDMVISVQSLGNLTFDDLDFYGCSNLTSFLAGLSATILQNSVFSMFRLCVNLTDCDLNGLDFSNVLNFTSMFEGCTVLANFDHSQLDMSSAVIVTRMFRNCPAMLDPAPEWWLIPEITAFEDCFLNNLLRSNYDDIPDEWKGIEP